MSWPADGKPRYVVAVTEGQLTGTTGQLQGGIAPNLTAHVLDRAYCHRAVFAVRSEDVALWFPFHTVSVEDRRQLALADAEDVAAELNARRA